MSCKERGIVRGAREDGLMAEEKKKVLLRLCVIGWGIPAVLLAFIVFLSLSPWSVRRTGMGSASLNAITAALAAVGLAAWAFFNLYLYRRLWKLFPYIGDSEKGWTYAEGVFGLQGVGTSMSSVLGMFLYLFTGDMRRGVLVAAVSLALIVLEMARFPGRIAEVEDVIGGGGS